MIVILSVIVGFFKARYVLGQLVSPQSGRHSPLQSHIHLARLHLDVTHILLSLRTTSLFMLSMLSIRLKADAELDGSHSAQRLHQRPSPVNTRQLREQNHLTRLFLDRLHPTPSLPLLPPLIHPA